MKVDYQLLKRSTDAACWAALNLHLLVRHNDTLEPGHSEQIHGMALTLWLFVTDHLVLEFEFVYSVIIPDTKTVKYLYNNGEYQHFNTELFNFDWDHAFDGKTVDEMWSVL